MITADDVLAAARHSHDALAPLQESGDWEKHPADLDWTCRQTLDHVVTALGFYAACLARRATTRPIRRDGAPEYTPPQLLDSLESAAAVLAAVIRDAGPDARAYHRAGMADGSGFAAMACAEILIHTEDIAATLSPTGYRGPDDLTGRVVQRLFPWAPQHGDPWELFRWCTGRAALPSHPRQGPDWFWWCAPLEEWTAGADVRIM